MSKVLLLFISSTLLLTSCSEKDRSEVTEAYSGADSAAVYYYGLRAAGKYGEYVAAMQSCDGTTPAYRKQMESLLRHHQLEVDREKRGISKVEVVRTEMHNADRMANVFLQITYRDGSQEELIFPVVHDGTNWRIR